MYSFIISGVCAVGAWCGLYFSNTCGYGWSTFFALLTFGVVQAIIGWRLNKQVKAAMLVVQAVLADGQKQLQAKVQRWQLRPPGSIQQAQLEIAKDQKIFVNKALALTEPLHKFDNWVPLMKRQIATCQFQLYWMLKDMKKVDELLPKVMFIDPTMTAMKIARRYMLNAPTEELEKLYTKSARRLRYNQNVLLAALWSWILVKRNDADGAFRALNEALKKSDNVVLKQNQEHLANNRIAHFSNAGLSDQWYALQLEEPKIRQQRSPIWR